MTDVFSKTKRSEIMRAIRGKDTKPEMTVRRLIHSMGFRYRLHRRDLPGCPDIVFVAKKKVVFVHGCYWHRHSCRKGQSVPTTRREFWTEKFEINRKRDQRHRRQLRRLGWDVMVIWECQSAKSKLHRLTNRVSSFLAGE